MPINTTRINDIINIAHNEKRNVLLEHEVYEILSQVGMDVPKYQVITSAEAKVNLTCEKLVAKVVSEDILHKTDADCIRFIENNPVAISKAFEEIKTNASKFKKDVKFRGVLFVEAVSFKNTLGHELLLSLRWDNAFGYVISFGLGGIWTEYLAKKMYPGNAVAMLPVALLDETNIKQLWQNCVAGEIISGKLRGQKKELIAASKVEAALNAMLSLAKQYVPGNDQDQPVFDEIEINPMVITTDGRIVPLDGLSKFSYRHRHQVKRPVGKIAKLLKPKSALVIGASASSMNPGRIILNNLVAGGGVKLQNIHCLQPKADEIDGVKCSKTPEELPNEIDMSVFTVPASEQTLDLFESLVNNRKVHTVTLISSGFAEVSSGRSLQNRLESIILNSRKQADGGVLVNGPNCLGIVSIPGGYNTFFLPPYKIQFLKNVFGKNLAFVSQSGAYLVMLTSAIGYQISPAYAISYGNQVDVSAADYLEYFITEDPEINVIATYVEGFKEGDGLRFAKAAQQLKAQGKTVLIMKGGRTGAGAQAAASHTAAIAGDHEVTRQTMQLAGVIEITNLDEYQDLLKVFVLLEGKKITGRKVAIVSNAGIECTTAADNLKHLELAKFSDATNNRLKELLPEGIMEAHNPVDATPMTATANFIEIVKVLNADAGVDCIVVSPVPPTPALNNLPAGAAHKEDITNPASLPHGFIEIFKSSTKPIVFAIDGGKLFDPCCEMMESAGLPTYRKIDRAINALEAWINSRAD